MPSIRHVRYVYPSHLIATAPSPSFSIGLRVSGRELISASVTFALSSYVPIVSTSPTFGLSSANAPNDEATTVKPKARAKIFFIFIIVLPSYLIYSLVY